MIDFETALAEIIRNSVRLDTETIPLASSCGRILAKDVVAPFSLPRFDNSRVDGYTLRAEDWREASVAKPLPINPLKTIFAGKSEPEILNEGEVFKIMTGAPVPSGANAVVMREEVELTEGLCLNRAPQPRENIRFTGGEVIEGSKLLAEGTAVTPPIIGLIASLGMDMIDVVNIPTISLIITGDEIVALGGVVQPGEIYDSISPMLSSALNQIGVSSLSIRFCRDDLETLADVMREAISKSNIVITVGGVSMGDRDFVREAALSNGVEEKFWQVAIKPGKPTLFGVKDSSLGRRTLLFGLPGNPVSAMVVFYLFVRPALMAMSGKVLDLMASRATLTTGIHKKDDRLEFVRGRMREEGANPTVEPLMGQESHMLTGLARANCLIKFPREAQSIESGTTVEIIRLEW